MLDKVVREEMVRERTVTVPERTRGRSLEVRSYSHIPEPGPNAPKLIRLIRNPVSQELGRPLPNKDIVRRSATQWIKPESARLVREALDRTALVQWPRPTREITRVPPRPRPSLDAWLNEGGER